MERLWTYHPIEGEAFHVHTFRCKHADEVPDTAYIDKAIELGAPRIVFTDHSPFPGDPFRNRMEIEALPEYINTMERLKAEYRGRIEILSGLEVEYLPSFIEFYHELKNNPGLDLLMLGQHFYEHEPGYYSFMDEDKSEEYIGLCEALIQGIETELFDVVAHPDRAFRRRKNFGSKEESLSDRVINAAMVHGSYLEVNYSSMHRKHQFCHEFWDRLPNQATMIYGLDAHSVEEMSRGMEKYREAFVVRLYSVKDAYYGFVVAVSTYVKNIPSRRDIVERFMDDNPEALTSDILEFISDQGDFDVAQTKDPLK